MVKLLKSCTIEIAVLSSFTITIKVALLFKERLRMLRARREGVSSNIISICTSLFGYIASIFC